ncbi:glycosyltransferase family 9 protein [Miltoncostaea marina]|uniref:glycosyltransferase family 9 protein n=1 Tax=Miltoncostaea marina TaxID=2843215 RepID=UPI001C3CB17D|nr:glycosyltransferase family 9 protein [Miltoncostaea marina]
MSAGAGRPRLVVLRALGLGDLLTAFPALRALAGAFPGHHRILAAPAPLAPLALASGAVDEVVPAAPLAPLPDALAAPDVAVNLHGCGPRSHRVLLALRPRRLVAFASAEAGVAGPRWRPDEHEVARWCRMLGEEGIPADPTRLELDPGGPGPGEPPPPAGATVVHPGAASGARRWPAERFAAVARAEAAAGRRVVVTGDAGDLPAARRIARLAGLPDADVLAGRTGLMALARTIAAAGRVVCGDTGVAHLATAVDTPSVVLFGPVPPALWGPPPDRPRHRALWRGRTGDPHAAATDPGLLAIGVDEVLAALAALPAPPPAAVASVAPGGGR